MALSRKIAYIDLTKKTIDITDISIEWRQNFLGGRGLDAFLLYKHLPRGCDPLKPDNVIIVSSGLMGGTLAADLALAGIMTKSPLTHQLAYASLKDLFASEMRWAGFDHLVITGKSKQPVYLFIKDGNIEIKSAKKMWGKKCSDTASIVRDDLNDPNIRVISIGKAGEKRVRFANVVSDLNNVTGRTGMGAVFGSKNMKAVACRGTLDLEIKHPADVLKSGKNLFDQYTEIDDNDLDYLSDEENNPIISSIGNFLLNTDGTQMGVNLLTEHGVDTQAALLMIHWAKNLKGEIIDDKLIDQLNLDSIDPEIFTRIIDDLTSRNDIWDTLAEGPIRASLALGSKSLSSFPSMKQFVKMHSEKSGFKSTSKGHCSKMHGRNDGIRLKGLPGIVGRDKLVRIISDCLGLTGSVKQKEDKTAFNQAIDLIRMHTGLAFKGEELEEIAYRCHAIEHFFNMREQRTRARGHQTKYCFYTDFSIKTSRKSADSKDIVKYKKKVDEINRLHGWGKNDSLRPEVFNLLKINELWKLTR